LKLFHEWCRGRGIKENDGGVNSTIIYLMFYKNFCKCYNAPPYICAKIK
jgi:hypothetical protein